MMDRTKNGKYSILLLLAALLLLMAPAYVFAEGEDASLAIVSAPVEMKVGERATVGCELNGADPGETITWASSNDSVASVDSKGEVTAGSPGSVEITASVPSLGLRASAMIKVSEIAATSIAIQIREYSGEDMLLPAQDMTIDDTLHLSVVIEPENVTVAPEVQWSSSNPYVLSVDANGVVTAKDEGEATVTAKAGELTDSMRFNVAPPPDNKADNYLLIGFAAIIALIIAFIIIIVARSARRRRIEREKIETRSEAADELKRKIKKQKETKKQRQARLAAKGGADRRTRIFVAHENAEDPLSESLPAAPESSDMLDNKDRAGISDAPSEGYEDGPDRPFSLDDID